MAELPVMPVATDALLGDTSHLSAAEFGAYMRILVSMWRAGGALPDDDARLARIAGMSLRQWQKAAPVVRAFLSPCERGVTQKRLLKEWLRVSEKSRAASRAAQAKWLKHINSGDANAYANAMRTQCNPNPNPNPYPEEKGYTAATPVLEAAREAPAGPAAPSSPCVDGREPDLWELCLHAAGHAHAGRVPTHWMPPAATLHVNRWRDELGLAEADILAVIEAQRRHFGGDPPTSPRAFDRAMQRLAGERARPALTAIDGGRLGAPQDTRRQAALAVLRSDADAG